MDSTIQKSYEKYPHSTFRTLLGLYRGHYGKLLLSSIFFIIKRIPAWIMPVIIANVINAATQATDESLRLIYWNGLVLLGLVLQNIFTNYFHAKYHSQAIRKVETGLRQSMIEKLQELSIPFQKELQSGRIQSKIMRDVEAIQMLSSQVFVSILNVVINLAVALSITFITSPTVFMFFLLTIPIAVVIIVFFRQRIKRSNADFRHKMEQTSAKVIEAIELAPIARAHALEKKEINRLSGHFGEIYNKGFHLDIIQANFGAVSWASFQFFQIVSLVFTGSLALRGEIQAGDIVMYQSYFSQIVTAVSGVITLIPTIAKGMESVTSIGEVLMAGEVENYTDKEKMPVIAGTFRFEQVHYRYPNTEQDVIDGLSLTVHPGETIAFVGESGSGKSTLLNLIIGFIRPTQGKIYLDDKDMEELDLRSFRKHLAVVPQSTILFSGTIRDNITYGMETVSEIELEQVLRAANLWEVVERLPDGLETVIGEHGDYLSGGQKQRVSIARALIRNPKVIVLDEATSALDTVSERKIQEALSNLSSGRTTFIVAHRLSTIRNADRIAVIDNGRCAEIGTYEELMAKKGRFYRFSSLQT